MFVPRFDSNKCKTQCKLGLGRINLLKNKKTMQLGQSRREVANMLRDNRREAARIRVEAIIREKLLLQAYETLELFLELLSVRVQLVEKAKDMQPDMIEALSSIVYASHRIQELPELAAIRMMLTAKYGKVFAAEAASDGDCFKWRVNTNLTRYLSVEAPPPDVKMAELSQIAQEFAVEWDIHAAYQDLMPAAAPPGGPPGPPPPFGGPAPPPDGPPPFSPPPPPRWTPSAEAPAAEASAAQPAAPPGAAATARAAPAPAESNVCPSCGAPGRGPQHHAEAGPCPDAVAAVSREDAGGEDGVLPDIPRASSAGPPPGAALPPPRYVKRSDSELQRRFDAAPGAPPAKDLGAAGPPSAPPAPRPPTPPRAPPPSAAPPAGAPLAVSELSRLLSSALLPKAQKAAHPQQGVLMSAACSESRCQ